VYRFCSLILCSFLLINISAQNVEFSARAGAEKVFEESVFTVEFTLKNAEGRNFIPPAFKNFTVTSGVSRSSNTTIINGKRSQSISFSYEISPKRTGNLIIEPATITVDGKEIKSNALKINVVKQDPNKKREQEEQFFVELRVSDSLVQIGQQITLEYILYTKIDIRSQKYLEQPEYDGFFAENMRVSRSAYRTDIINGSEYYYKVIDRVALFPQQTGNYTFGPVKFRLGAATEGERGGFFFNQRLKYFVEESNSVKIKVGGFGASAPESFSGAVGKYQMEIQVPSTRITADDAFTFLMKVVGDGDSRTVNPPALNLDPDLDNYDPNTVKDETYVSKGKIINEKVFEFIVVPKRTGGFIVQPEFSYFDIDSSDFVTIKADSIQFFVSPGTGVSKIKTDERITKKELLPPLENISVKKKSASFFNSIWHWVLLGIIFIGILAMFLKYWRLVQENKIDPSIKRSNAAQRIALSRLLKAEAFIEKGQNKEAFAEISKTYKEYLSDKWTIDYSSLNTASIEKLLKDRGIEDSTITNSKYCLDQCEMAIYAGANPETLLEVRNKMAQIIEAIEQ